MTSPVSVASPSSRKSESSSIHSGDASDRSSGPPGGPGCHGSGGRCPRMGRPSSPPGGASSARRWRWSRRGFRPGRTSPHRRRVEACAAASHARADGAVQASETVIGSITFSVTLSVRRSTTNCVRASRQIRRLSRRRSQRGRGHRVPRRDARDHGRLDLATVGWSGAHNRSTQGAMQTLRVGSDCRNAWWWGHHIRRTDSRAARRGSDQRGSDPDRRGCRHGQRGCPRGAVTTWSELPAGRGSGDHFRGVLGGDHTSSSDRRRRSSAGLARTSVRFSAISFAGRSSTVRCE